MTREREIGDPKNAFRLFTDLMRTFKESELFKNCTDNKAFVFDAMMGIGQFTATTLKVFEASMREYKVDLVSLYRDKILPGLTSNDAVERLLKEHGINIDESEFN